MMKLREGARTRESAPCKHGKTKKRLIIYNGKVKSAGARRHQWGFHSCTYSPLNQLLKLP